MVQTSYRPTELLGEVNEGGEEGEVGGDAVGVEEEEEEEGGVDVASLAKGRDEGGVGDDVGGEAEGEAHLVEKAKGEGELVGVERAVEDDVEDEDGSWVGGDIEHLVEEGEGAMLVGLAGEEGDYEARGEPVEVPR